jgi:hypothetical protein
MMAMNTCWRCREDMPSHRMNPLCEECTFEDRIENSDETCESGEEDMRVSATFVDAKMCDQNAEFFARMRGES